jgi:2-iminobutanoate/2-iminopropanoate deaminase
MKRQMEEKRERETDMATQNRRDFFRGLGLAALLGGAGGGGAMAAASSESPSSQVIPKREIVPGSPYATFSRATRCGHLVYVAGVVGQRPGSKELVSEDFEPQCRQAMDNLKASVEASGTVMAKVLKCNVYLADFDDFAAFNQIYTTYFPEDPPARSTVVVKELVVKDALLEIDCVACL